MPTTSMVVAVVNKSTVLRIGDLKHIVNAINTDLQANFLPIWNVDVTLIVMDDLVPKTAGMVLVDRSQEAGALGYHQVTSTGDPLGIVGVIDSQRAGSVSEVLDHETKEEAVNPLIREVVTLDNGRMTAKEVCDSVERDLYTNPAYPDVKLSNFVTPDYFAQKFGAMFPGLAMTGRYDFLGKLKGPFPAMTAGGYSNLYENGQWRQIFASKEAEELYRLGSHSRVPRLLMGREKWRPSDLHTLDLSGCTPAQVVEVSTMYRRLVESGPQEA